eukprot:PhF_6_TR10368/c0_g1_i1/m.16110/K01941/E6.3.4.6; urea carboxylase
MFDKILIANRGEIACRIIRTCKRLDIKSVSVFSSADAIADHVLLADESVPIGNDAPSESYLCIDKIIAAAKQTGAQAIHPGYGFLSESTEFAIACEEAGIVFIGPTIQNMKDFALKHVARELAEVANVPIAPGSPVLQSCESAKEHAARIGLPVILKSTGGGGGIGMQLCHTEDDIPSAFERATRMSSANFRDSGVYLERFIAEPRHIEVQIFGDGQGNVVALGERECSVQRRFQKVLEESPSPFVSSKGPEYRKQLFDCAVALGKSAKYRSAGTVEFVVDDTTGDFYFLEVNTRLQVEHAVTEMITSLDLVEWMIRLAAGENLHLDKFQATMKGHSIEVRVYAEDPGNNYRPSSGLLTNVELPALPFARYDGWVHSGTVVSNFYDPLLVKIIVHGGSREEAVERLTHTLGSTDISGITTNLPYLLQISKEPAFRAGATTTQFVKRFPYLPCTVDVVTPGLATTIQDYPGRVGLWDVGVSPSGPMDHMNFRIANALVGNSENDAGFEITLTGPTLKFNTSATIALTGAAMVFSVNGTKVPMWSSVNVNRGDTVQITKMAGQGCRSYLAIRGGINVPRYLGSRSTFVLGNMGGIHGGVLKSGDVIPIFPHTTSPQRELPAQFQPSLSNAWEIGVLYGPHGAPDFFTEKSIGEFFNTTFTVHANSNRLGVRLQGSFVPEWSRPDGGEAGLHPSNIHDCVYAIGSINFTGDFPVILTADGPSLGGFVCPATVPAAEMWKVGQVKAGDTVRFIRVRLEDAVQAQRNQATFIQHITESSAISSTLSLEVPKNTGLTSAFDIVLFSKINSTDPQKNVMYRLAGDQNVLVEYGPMELDINLRCKVEQVIQALRAKQINGLLELSPGVRSVQVKYDPLRLGLVELVQLLRQVDDRELVPLVLPCRKMYLPIAIECRWTKDAIRRYTNSFGSQKPYLPSNIDFVSRINGLPQREDVARLVTEASYLVLGLGDVYLGAPCATPLDPRHRLVTSKYNPARTFTPEGVVGIGGAYMCIYGMDSPGGYQLIGRTLPIWNAFTTHRVFESGKPWLLRSFDQVQFYPVSEDELEALRTSFSRGTLDIRVEQTVFDQEKYNAFLKSIEVECNAFRQQQQQAFAEERRRWEIDGLMGATGTTDPTTTSTTTASQQLASNTQVSTFEIQSGRTSVDAMMNGTVRLVLVNVGDQVVEGQHIMSLEAMKMELAVQSHVAGRVTKIFFEQGCAVTQGCPLVEIEEL